MPVQKKKQSKLKKILGFFNPRSLKGGIALFALVFAIGGGVYFVYRSFAATGGAGGYHTCWVKSSDATLWCWGKNDAGQLGLGDTTNRTVPTKVNISDVVAVTTGLLHTCAKKVDNSLWCWGDNREDQLGVGFDLSTTARLLPTRVNLDNIAQISAGGIHTCASKIDGTLWCWGNNTYGQLGIGSTAYASSTPKQLYFGSVSKLSAGRDHTCASKIDGTLWCWGSNRFGQLGIGSTINTNAPKQLYFDKTAEISAGMHSTCASKTDGTLWCWGDSVGLGTR
jgi:alpha-tubulin suppressor-like RCC1 family protein